MGLFGDDPALHQLREDYAMPSNVIPDAERREAFTAFIFWATWATVTERPGRDITYTHNWPPDDLVGNHATPVMVVTSVISFVLLLGGIGGLAWFFAASRDVWRSQVRTPAADPLLSIKPTPSMNATHRYFWVVGALAVGQIIAGIVIAHYGVEGTGFYGFPLSEIVPYSLARTWHVQMGMLWIATSWLATGLCLAPLVAGHEPRLQRLGVNVLLVALVVVVGGSMFGQALAIHQVLSENVNFWVGHQGYEYLDLGRFWQTLLFVGLLLWLVLMIRPLMHAWKQAEGNTRRRQFLGIFMLSVAAIALFYAPGLIPGPAHQPRHRRVLALVGRPPLGRGLLRGLRDDDHRPRLRPAGAGARPLRHDGDPVQHHPLPLRRRAGHAAPPLLHRHHAHHPGRRRHDERAGADAAGHGGL